MGYRHIDNLQASSLILLEPEVWALEKIHGTSAHVGWNSTEPSSLKLFSGEQKEAFATLFDQEGLREKLAAEAALLGCSKLTIYGEAYGGKIQGQATRYGPEVRFVAFEVLADERWLDVPEAEQLALRCGLEFVWFVLIKPTLANLDAARDAPSAQAFRNGMGEQLREGVVLRCKTEKRTERGERILAKYKRDEFRETKTPHRLDEAERTKILEARKVADEWVTETRLDHVLQALELSETELKTEHISAIVREMVADVRREGAGQFEESRDAFRAIGTEAARLVKMRIAQQLRGAIE